LAYRKEITGSRRENLQPRELKGLLQGALQERAPDQTDCHALISKSLRKTTKAPNEEEYETSVA